MRGKAIRQFLIEGIPDGRWVSELSNWTGKAYKIPRTYVSTSDDRPDLNYTGVYFLFGQNDDGETAQAYIGAVSYTHLDVYKRQAQSMLNEFLMKFH